MVQQERCWITAAHGLRPAYVPPPGSDGSNRRFAAAAAAASGHAAGEERPWTPWDQVARKAGIQNEEQGGQGTVGGPDHGGAHGPGHGGSDAAQGAAGANPLPSGDQGGTSRKEEAADEVAEEEDKTSRHDAAPDEGGAPQGDSKQEHGDADWDEDANTWNGGHAGNEDFNDDDYPPEVVTAVDISWALLPTKERRIRHGLQIALILDVPNTTADIWISTGPPTPAL